MNIFLAGHNGMVGSAINKILKNKIKTNKYLKVITKKRSELDLLNQNAVSNFFRNNEIDIVIIAAARVGGIQANNNFPAEFIYNNLQIQCNLIHTAYINKVNKILFLGSSCIYPRDAEQPMKENYLLSGYLEKTNEPYAIAKIAGIKLCESYNRQYQTDYRSIMPTNLYGQGDNFDPESSHVIPGLITKMHLAKINKLSEFYVWGTGKPRREFLHVDDMASASLHILNLSKEEFNKNVDDMTSHINVGSGKDISIKELAYIVRDVVDYEGKIQFDYTKPDGSPQKLMDSSLIQNLGWEPKIKLKDGIKKTYEWYLSNHA